MTATLNVFVTPKSSCDAVDGYVQTEQGREVKVRVRAIPDEGKANKAVCVVIAKYLRVPKSAVAVVSGSTSRHKRLSIEGVLQEDVDNAFNVVE